MALPIRKLLVDQSDDKCVFEVRIIGEHYSMIIDRKTIHADKEAAVHSRAYAQLCQVALDLQSVQPSLNVQLVQVETVAVPVSDDLIAAAKHGGGKGRRRKRYDLD